MMEEIHKYFELLREQLPIDKVFSIEDFKILSRDIENFVIDTIDKNTTYARKHSAIKGISKHPLYKVWNGMKNRCYNPNVPCYERYGARGIQICEEWLKSPEAFISFCETLNYKKGLHLDRINNDGNYEPGNVRFVTPMENSKNTRRNVHLTFDGETKILEDWCRFYNIPSKAVHSRIKNGWDIKEALTTPILKVGEKRGGKILTPKEASQIRQEYKSGDIFQHQLAEKYGVTTTTINAILTNKSKKHKI